MQVSKAKAERAKNSKGSTVVKKPQVMKPEVKQPVKTGINKTTADAIVIALKPMQSAVSDLLRKLEDANNEIKILNARVDDLQNQPMRVKVHRDGNKLIDYFDRIPVEVTKLNS